MIELNKKTQQDFLNREWVQRLLAAGVDMSDAKYIIGKDKLSKYDPEPDLTDYVWYKESTAEVYDECPTYTVSELLYKLHEYIYPTIDGKVYSGGLCLWKDAPFYIAQYRLSDEHGKHNEKLFFCDYEYPIESLAALLVQCHMYDIGTPRKDVGDISSK